jgi:hypothetical protein
MGGIAPFGCVRTSPSLSRSRGSRLRRKGQTAGLLEPMTGFSLVSRRLLTDDFGLPALRQNQNYPYPPASFARSIVRSYQSTKLNMLQCFPIPRLLHHHQLHPRTSPRHPMAAEHAPGYSERSSTRFATPNRFRRCPVACEVAWHASRPVRKVVSRSTAFR